MSDKPSIKEKARLPKPLWRSWQAKSMVICLALAVLVPGIWFLLENAGKTRTAMLDSFAMGSYVEQTVWGAKCEAATKDVNTALLALESAISWRELTGPGEGRDIYALNRAAGAGPVTVSPETWQLLETTQTLSRNSGGAFDITLGPVTRLWDFDNDPHLPDEALLAQAMAVVGYENLLMDKDGSVALALPQAAVDLGAIGKGAACDTAVEQYRQAEVSGAVIAVGGSVGLYGSKPGGGPWRVSVRDPAGAGSLGVLALETGFVSTSGSYEKFFEQDGQTYCHLLDPRTGYPAHTGLVSVTVWCAGSGALSDGLATACFVLGLNDSLPLLETYGAQAIFIDESGCVTVTAGLRDRFTLTAEGYSLAGEGAP